MKALFYNQESRKINELDVLANSLKIGRILQANFF